MSFQDAAQGILQLAEQHPVKAAMVLVGSAVGSMAAAVGLLLRFMSGRFLKAFDSIAADVKGFAATLAAHEREDTARFSHMENEAHRRHEETMEAINAHANAMQVAVSDIGIRMETASGERQNIRDRVSALEGRTERRSRPR